MTFPDAEPVITASSIVALVAAVLALGIAFGLPVTDQQREAILGLVAVVAPIAVAVLVRPNVTPNAKVQILVDDAVLSTATTGGPAPH
jgi:hypothetical protein